MYRTTCNGRTRAPNPPTQAHSDERSGNKKQRKLTDFSQFLPQSRSNKDEVTLTSSNRVIEQSNKKTISQKIIEYKIRE